MHARTHPLSHLPVYVQTLKLCYGTHTMSLAAKHLQAYTIYNHMRCVYAVLANPSSYRVAGMHWKALVMGVDVQGSSYGSEGTSDGSEGTSDGSEGTSDGSEGSSDGSEGSSDGGA